jgi:hypothetical protein
VRVVANTVELDKKFSELETRFRDYEQTLPPGDPRRVKAAGLALQMRAWQRDLDRLYLVWDRWSTDKKQLEESHAAVRNSDAEYRESRQRQFEMQLDVDVPSFHVFGENLLDHVAETTGYLFDDEDLRNHDLLCRREILPKPLQERAVTLRQQLADYWETAADGRAAGSSVEQQAAENHVDLAARLQGLQAYAYGMAGFLDAAVRHPALKLKKVGLFEEKPGPRRRWLWGAGAIGALLLVLVGMSWTCVPASIDDVFSTEVVFPPLPAGCQMTAVEPTAEVAQKLESRREARGLVLERRVSCTLPKRSAGPGSLENFYIDKTLQHQRQVFLAEAQAMPDGRTLVVVESTLVPRWKYLKRLAGQCDAEL